MISITLDEINDLAPADRCVAWWGVRNQIFIRMKRHEIETPTFVWVRECGRDGLEHLHVMPHVPRGLGYVVAESLRVWRAPPAIDVRPWSDLTWRTKGGKVRGAIGYILKQQSAEASARNGFDRVTVGAPIYGKRSGMTRNLLKKNTAPRPAVIE